MQLFLIHLLLLLISQIHHQRVFYPVTLVRRVFYFEGSVVIFVLFKVVQWLILSAEAHEVNRRVLFVSLVHVSDVKLGGGNECLRLVDVVFSICRSSIAKNVVFFAASSELHVVLASKAPAFLLIETIYHLKQSCFVVWRLIKTLNR